MAGSVVRRKGWRVSGDKVAEDVKVPWKGWGVSVHMPEVMGSKWWRSVEEGDGRARAGVRTGSESPLYMATMLVAT